MPTALRGHVCAWVPGSGAACPRRAVGMAPRTVCVVDHYFRTFSLERSALNPGLGGHAQANSFGLVRANPVTSEEPKADGYYFNKYVFAASDTLNSAINSVWGGISGLARDVYNSGLLGNVHDGWFKQLSDIGNGMR